MPFDAAMADYEMRHHMAKVGALFEYEKIAHSRGMVEKPLQIQWVAGLGPSVEEEPKTSDPKPAG